MQETSEFLRKEPCPSCGSKDNLARYTDGHGWCFGCGHREKGEGDIPTITNTRRSVNQDLSQYQEAVVQSLSARGITEDTCRLWGVRVGEFKGERAHFYPYFAEGAAVGCKVRGPNKDFNWIGQSAPSLFGQHLWSKGKMLVVTEGEIDALTVSQVQGNKWPVVSIPNGAQGAKKAIQKNLEYFAAFEQVILMFDQDEPGRKAAEDCAELFEPGKCKIASLPFKDPNECLKAGKADSIIQAIWNAKAFRPDGIVSGTELWDTISSNEVVASVPYPWLGLNMKTQGMRKGELVTVTAGSGVGKSALVRELAHHLIQSGETVGMLMLEENPKRSSLGLMGVHLSKPLHLSREGISDEQLREAFDQTVGSGRVFLYNHFGSTDVANLVNRIRYLARGCNCGWIILDHLSIVVSGLGDGDERRLIDNAMTTLRTLVEETGVGMILVSHLKRPEGNKGHEEGASTSLSQLRGSHSIAQLSDMVIGLERNQQSEDKANETVIRVLKNRFSGEVGVCSTLFYDKHTGRLSEQPTVGDTYGF